MDRLPDRPENEIHAHEEVLQRATEDKMLCLLFNKHKGFWQAAIWDPSHWYIGARLRGCPGIEYGTRSHWRWVFDCCQLLENTKPGERHYEPIEPGPWLTQILCEQSAWQREDVPEECRLNPGKFAEWLENQREYDAEAADAKESEEWIKDTEKEIYNQYTGKKIYLPNYLRD